MNEEQCEYMARWLQLRGFHVHTWRENDDGCRYNDMRRKDSCKYHGDICIWLYHENQRGECLNGVIYVSDYLTIPSNCDYLTIPLKKVGMPFDSSKMDFKTAIQKAVEKYVEKYPDKAKDAEPFLKGGSFYDGEEPCMVPYYIQKREREALERDWRQ